MKINCNFKGEKNGNAKLSDDTIDELKKEWVTGQWTFRSIGVKYGISHGHAYKIIKGKTRKDLQS